MRFSCERGSPADQGDTCRATESQFGGPIGNLGVINCSDCITCQGYFWCDLEPSLDALSLWSDVIRSTKILSLVSSEEDRAEGGQRRRAVQHGTHPSHALCVASFSLYTEVQSVMYDSGLASLEHLLLSRNPFRKADGFAKLTDLYCTIVSLVSSEEDRAEGVGGRRAVQHGTVM